MFTRLLPIGILAFAASLHAQNRFVVIDSGRAWPVKAVHETLLDIGSRSIAVTKDTVYSLRPAPVYRPGFVQIRSFEVQPVLQIVTGNYSANADNLIYIDASLVSDVPLRQLYVVLEMMTRTGQRGLIYSGLPDLEPNKPKTFQLRMHAQQNVSRAAFIYHFFSEGMEILNSKMTPAYLEEQRRKTADYFQPDRDAAPVKISRPIYPRELVSSQISGSARVRFTIDVTGAVADPQVTSANNPLFAGAALAAVQQWRFSPAFQSHRLVPTTLEIELKFTPPPPQP
jgi:TonB family protein